MKKNISRKKRKYVIWLKRAGFVCLAIFLLVLLIAVYKQLTKPLYVSPVSLVTPRPVQANEFDLKKEALEKLLQEKKIEYKAIARASESVYVIILPDESQVVVTLQKDLSLQVSSLQLILSRLTIEGKRFSRLDVRYDKPVIVFK